MRIVFMGTPDFAVPSLRALIRHGDDIAAVYTQPDKPKGRGYQMMPPPVKRFAQEQGLSVFQPVSVKTEEEIARIRAFAPDMIIVVAYGKILPPAVLEIPPLGCVNVHASLLPKYRGAAPIQWSVVNGETETGVTTMYMAQGLDTGDMILKKSTPIGENETSSQLHDRLAELGAELLGETLEQIEKGIAPRTHQDDSLSCYAPMITKEMSLLDFTAPARDVHNRIRGLTGTAFLGGKRLKLFESEYAGPCSGCPGEITVSDGTFLVACGDGCGVRIRTLQPEGGKRMEAAAFLRGNPIQAGTILSGK